MFCPRCGRPVSRTANFCGGCGLPKAEIERMSQPAPQPVQVDINELDATISQLEGDLTGINPVENYTTETDVNTNNVENSLESKEKEPISLEFEDSTQPGQSEFSANAPVHPMYEQGGSESRVQHENRYTVPQTQQTAADQTLSTTDFVWMMLVSGIPVIGLIYLIYLGFVQQENANKRAYARATMIIVVFGILISVVFALGVMMTTFMFW